MTKKYVTETRSVKQALDHGFEWKKLDRAARVGDFCNSNYIEYESNNYRNKTLTINGYLKENHD